MTGAISPASETMLLLKVIDGKIDAIHARLKDREEDHKDHEDRLRSLERSKWMSIGGASVVSFLISLVWSLPK